MLAFNKAVLTLQYISTAIEQSLAVQYNKLLLSAAANIPLPYHPHSTPNTLSPRTTKPSLIVLHKVRTRNYENATR